MVGWFRLSCKLQSLTGVTEWSCSFVIVDPSIYSNPGSSDVGIGVTCFHKKYVEWLPQVDRGDIVILRKLKVREILRLSPENLTFFRLQSSRG